MLPTCKCQRKAVKEMSDCYVTGFALFYAKSGRMNQSSVVALLSFFING